MVEEGEAESIFWIAVIMSTLLSVGCVAGAIFYFRMHKELTRHQVEDLLNVAVLNPVFVSSASTPTVLTSADSRFLLSLHEDSTHHIKEPLPTYQQAVKSNDLIVHVL
jgi:predicted ABC-type exoprotein transport system permease subunit